MPYIQDDSRKTQLVYVHDPMCSWCWGFRPVLDELLGRLPPTISVTRLLGGLAPDSDQPMPAALQTQLQQTWRRIQQRIPGTRFNFDFWRTCQPRRSTWPACRAVIAARSIDAHSEPAMILAIQHAYYRDARNPSDASTLVALAGEVGLDERRFATLLDAPQTHAMLNEEITQSRALGVDSFPSLRLQTDTGRWPVPIDYRDSTPMLDTIGALLG